MNLILVRNLKNKNIYRIVGDAIYTSKENTHTKIIIYKEYMGHESQNLLAMDVDLFWKTYEVTSLNNI